MNRDNKISWTYNGFMPAEWPSHGYVGLLEDDAVRLIRTAESLTGPAMASKLAFFWQITTQVRVLSDYSSSEGQVKIPYQFVHSRILLWDRDNTFITKTCSSPAFGLS